MPAGIKTTDGLFTVREAAWHGLGTLFDHYPTRKEAQSVAHNWEPVQEPLYRRVDHVEEDGTIVEAYKVVEDYKVNVRSDDKTGDGELGVVGDSYVPVLNNELWDIAEAVEKSGSDVMFETAGSLDGGKKVWVLVRLEEPLLIKGDPRGQTIPYFALQNSHDGTTSFRGQATLTRIVCQNTARAADMDAQNRGTEFVFRHSKNVGERIAQAQEALSGWRESLVLWQQQSEQLISQQVDPVKALDFLERFIPMPPENIISERTKKNIESDRAKWLESYNGFTGEGIKGTSYGLVQASLEFLNWHRRANTAESRFKRTFLTRDGLVARAVQLSNEAYTDSIGLI